VSRIARIRREWPLAASVATTVVFLVLGDRWLADLGSPAWFGLMLGWLFGAILVSAFAVVRHAEALAEQVHEPLGTLVLTLSMSGMEMMMITAIMYTGSGESSLARDTMLAIVMIVLNGLVGASLLLGGLRYHEQTYNLYGTNALPGRHPAAGGARADSPELHRVEPRPDPLAAPGRVPHLDVARALRRVPRNPDAAPSRVLRLARDSRRHRSARG
jgi:sodium/calcium exchanger protein